MAPDYRAVAQPAPEGWLRLESGDWVEFRPATAQLPPQGWKIHVSACLENAERIADRVSDYCIEHRIAFKLIRNRQLLLLRNSKYADRSASGKFLTLYPRDEGEFERLLADLNDRLKGEPGPYILSDLRWDLGPLYIRYGGFAPRFVVGPSGEEEPAIENDSGELVPDRRTPTFAPPPWVSLPMILGPHLAARNRTTLEGLPFRISRALHFSNGGGVYLAHCAKSGDAVVVKEARPYAGLSWDGVDAVTRLRRERDTLARLAGLGSVPMLRDYATLGEQEFLVEEFIEGATLSSLMVQRYPLVSRSPQQSLLTAYADWAVGICKQVERAVDAIHRRSVVIGDIHPSNILVRPSGEIALIDWETASLVEDGGRPTIGNPDFMAPRDREGFDIDRYALASLRLYLFLPLTALMRLDACKARQFGETIEAQFPVGRDFLGDAVATIAPSKQVAPAAPDAEIDLVNEPGAWLKLRDSMAAGILASATPDRKDRLFPGDIEQFAPAGGVNFANGAAGVLYALHSAGVARQQKHEEWLLQQAAHAGNRSELGFYDGLHGVAFAFERLGNRQDAMKVLDICVEQMRRTGAKRSLDLRTGLAGMGLNLLHFATATGDPSLMSAARAIVDEVAERLNENEAPEISGQSRHAGLMRGSSGAALLFIRWFEETGDRNALEFAAAALRRDLRCCVPTHDGALHVNESRRTMPYLAEGSVGIGMVLQEYLAHRRDEEFAEALAAIRLAAESQFFVQSGLFNGRAGMILFLSRDNNKTDRPAPALTEQIRRLSWHALSFNGYVAFPGDQLLRLSMDLATGTAGVMLALGAGLSKSSVSLPFFARPNWGM
jgi:tRNA A-37 threonylcarbamoyl transferase component Bud32